MSADTPRDWEQQILSPEKVLKRIVPGMRIFIGTGVAEPRTLVRHLLDSDLPNLADLELIQLAGFGQALRPQTTDAGKYRFKTFFSGWVAGDAVAAGTADLIPSRYSRIPRRIASGQIPVDAAFIQVSPPDAHGWCSLGVAVDAATQAMGHARLRVAEICPQVPRTFGDTHVKISDFDCLVRSDAPLYLFDRWQPDPVVDRLAAHVASVIADGSCIAFSFGPFYEALARHLTARRDLGIHSPFFTDALMDLVNSGAVTNRRKKSFAGKSVASYAVGSDALMQWLDGNPVVEFHGIERVFNPLEIGRNPDFVAVLRVEKVDVSGRIAMAAGRGIVAAGPEEATDFVNGAELSDGGMTLCALKSRDSAGRSNVCFSLDRAPHVISFREAVDVVATEHGVAVLSGRSLRERAQALIDIAHPEDRPHLAERAKAANVLYPDQIVLAGADETRCVPVDTRRVFKGGLTVRFRTIRPSDEEQMRRLFYRFSDEAVYYRYFSAVTSMPHEKMQQYVNVDCTATLSVVGLTGSVGSEQIVAEARYVRDGSRPTADVAFIVEDAYQRRGIATFLFDLLARQAAANGIRTFTADVLATNRAMMTVFERSGLPLTARFADGAYVLRLDLPVQPAAGP